MKTAIFLICCLTVAPVIAQDAYREDVSGLLYLSKDFGGGSSGQDKGLKLGFTLDHSYTPVNRLLGMRAATRPTLRQSLVDLEYSTGAGYFSRFTIGGMDALTYNEVLHQNGGSSSRWPMGLSTTQVVIGGLVLVAGGYFAYDELADDGGEDDDD